MLIPLSASYYSEGKFLLAATNSLPKNYRRKPRHKCGRCKVALYFGRDAPRSESMAGWRPL
jgi:hypothetical protein